MKQFLILIVLAATAFTQEKTHLRLWYDQPAGSWNEALPIGNGHLAAMVFGMPATERLQLNEETVWAGGPNNNVKPDAFPVIRQIRELLFEKRYLDAQHLVDSAMLPYGNSGMPYQPVGNLLIAFPGHEAYANYSRELDLERAVTTTTYTVGEIEYKRLSFASLVHGIIITRLTANKKGSITCSLSMESPQKSVVRVDGRTLILAGVTSDHEGRTGLVRFQANVGLKVVGGKVTPGIYTISIKQADEVLVYISVGTNVRAYNDISGVPSQKASSLLMQGMKRSYASALKAHVNTYQRYFNRVKLWLGETDSVKNTTSQRIMDFSRGDDPQLASTYFQFGRYLLIASSFPGSQAANLQGKWNDKMLPPWDSKYTININTEMNYWPTELTNLSEMNEPLFSLIRDLSRTGRQSASVMYHVRGWMAHHNTDLWRITGQVDAGYYGLWPMGGAWLCRHVWEHYLYTGDKQFLRRMYPVLKGAALYYVDALQIEPEHGWLVVAPSISPENSYLKGKHVSVTAGCTMDNQIVFELFSNVIRASEILRTDARFADTLKEMRKRLPPMHIGQYGQVQEWLNDWDDPKDTHRHISHLFGLYPAFQISPIRTPELFEAAKVTLNQRGDVSTGWSMGWKVNFWARLLDGNHAYKLISDQLKLVPADSLRGQGGTYPNMFDAHPPFQIDGNFGCTAGIAEMLLQSHDGAVHILPALPDAWKNGSVRGLMARGGFEVSITWNEGRIHTLSVYSKLGGVCRLRVLDEIELVGIGNLKEAKGENPNPFYVLPTVVPPVISASAHVSKPSRRSSYVYDLTTRPGGVYRFKLRNSASK